MAISYISTAQAYATTITLPTHAAGDLIFIWAIRAAGALPTPPAGWTSVTNSGSTIGSLGAAAFYKLATSSSETSGTWSDSVVLIVNVYRGTASTPGAASQATGTGTVIGYPALTANAPTTSWFLRFSGHGTASNVNSATVTGYTFRSTVAPNIPSLDSNGAPGSNPTLTNQTVNASADWFATTIELSLPVVTNTSQFFAMF